MEFLGWQEPQALLGYYRNCAALLFPQEEDFGISAVEAMACGKPVIAYHKGGALESVVEGKTGVFFHEQTPRALAEAMAAARRIKFDPATIRANAERFDRKIFNAHFSAFVSKALE